MKSLNLENLRISTRLIAEEALRRGFLVNYIPGGRIKTGVLILKNKQGTYIAKSTIGGNTRGYGVFVATNKYLMSQLLEYFNIRTPKTKLISDLDSASKVYLEFDKNVVVKPVDTNHGVGVTTSIKNENDLKMAVLRAQRESNSKDVLIQEKCVGIDYRLLVVGKALVAAGYREAACVFGDGKSTIRELIGAENNNPLRGFGHSRPLTLIPIKEAEAFLLKNDVDINSVPLKDAKIVLSDVANLSRGGRAIDITDNVHKDVKKMAIEAAKIAGLGVCGVDIMATDISLDPCLSGAKIIELNECPGIRMHHFPSEGKPRDAASAILDQIISGGAINE